MSVNDTNVPNTATIKKVAEKVRNRRESLDLDQDLARYGGPSRSTVSTLENNGRWPLRQRTRNSWAMTLGWEPDAFERMVKGEEPKELQEGYKPPPGGAARVKERMLSADAAVAMMDQALDDARAEFIELLRQIKANGDND